MCLEVAQGLFEGHFQGCVKGHCYYLKCLIIVYHLGQGSYLLVVNQGYPSRLCHTHPVTSCLFKLWGYLFEHVDLLYYFCIIGFVLCCFFLGPPIQGGDGSVLVWGEVDPKQGQGQPI